MNDTTIDKDTLDYKEICQCKEEWKGEFCHLIICEFGHPDSSGKRCTCRFHYEGFHCNKIKEGECLKGRRSYKTFR